MRAKGASKYIRVVDFMSPYDRMRRGTVSASEFRRSLEACGCFGDLTEGDHTTVLQAFVEVPDRPQRPLTAGAARPSPVDRVNYAAFCEILQPVGDKRVRLTDDDRLVQQMVQKRAEAADSPLGGNVLSREGELKVHDVTARILQSVRASRVPVRDLLQSFDPRGSNAKGATHHAAHQSPGCISRSQYLRGMQSGALGTRFSEQELALLFCKYDRNGEFNYYLFCRDLEKAQKDNLAHIP
ncbi:hypothetical protein T484DRAFT_2793406 [Baffinella frigidus]|nr:hypothetical protein T484DRAFT_2793406 [Cryptophyta sp. CCMP2293]